MAEVCLALSMPPSEYWALTTDEENALLKALRKQHKRRR